MPTAHLNICNVPLQVEYTASSDTHADIQRVFAPEGLDDLAALLAPDVKNSIRVACVRHHRVERDFLRRCEEQERTEA